MRRLILLLSIFLLTGCLPLSDNPVTPASVATMDSRLSGTWRLDDIDRNTGRVNGVTWLHIARLDSRTPYLEAAMISMERGRMDLSRYLLHTSRVGNRYYLNVRTIRKGKASKGYLIVKYVLDDKGLSLYLPPVRQLGRLISAGKLRGETNTRHSSVRITAGSEELARVLVDHDREIYTVRPLGPFRRIR